MTKKILSLWCLVLSLLLSGCIAATTTETTLSSAMTTSMNSTTTTTTTTTTISLTTTTTEELFDYLGENPPTGDEIRFDPYGYLANSTWFWHSAPVFSPDGTEMYWSKYFSAVDHIEIWYTRKVDGIWTAAIKLTIEGLEGDTNCPTFLSGDDGLYFVNYFDGVFTIYRVTRTESGWGNPVALDLPIPEGMSIGWSFSFANNGNLYLSLSSIDGLIVYQIYVFYLNNGSYENPILIENQGTGLYGNGDVAIAPDENYMIFMSSRDTGFGYHDLYISFRTGAGTYSEPINLGNQINSSSEEGRAYITRDGQYLFYTTYKAGDWGYNSYWIRIDQLDAYNAH